MDVIKEIIKNSAIGPYSFFAKGIVLSIFSSIVCTLFIILTVLLVSSEEITKHFAY